MKRQFAAAVSALSLCVLLGGARDADAQALDAIVPTTIDSLSTTIRPVADAAPAIDAPVTEHGSFSPILQPSRSILREQSPAVQDPRSIAPAFQGRSWKTPTSRTLMIAGVAAVAIGLFVVEGDAGAIMAMAGGGVAVYGLYLHYNR